MDPIYTPHSTARDGLTPASPVRMLAGMTMTLLRRAEVYAPEPLGVCDLLLGGSRILWLGHALTSLPKELAVEEIDLNGRVLIPGLIDGHVHVTGGGGEAGFQSRVPALALSRFTRAGVTSVVGLLGADDVARGPRELLAAVYGLREAGLNAWAHVGGYHLPSATLTGSLRGDLTLIEPLIGAGELAISDHRSSQPTLDELLRVAAEVHVAGLLSGKAGIVHLHLGDGPRGLDLVRRALDTSELPARVFNPTHVNRRRKLFAEALELAARGCHVDITAFPVAEDEDAWPAEEALLRYLDSGAPPERVTVSSDAGGSLPCFDAQGDVSHYAVGESGALLGTLKQLRERGQAWERVLPAFTSNPAQLLRLHGKGRIAAGADADLVALDEHVAVHAVFVRGVAHVLDGRLQRHGMFERDNPTGAD